MAISFVLNAHLPFVRENEPGSAEEHHLFEHLSETYLPILEVCDRLEEDHIPFRLAFSISPTLCHMLRDELLKERYREYMEHRIRFGEAELNRTGGADEQDLVLYFCKRMSARKTYYEERCGADILGVFREFQKKGRIELLGSTATGAFLPFYSGLPEAVQAQFEIALASHRSCFEKNPQGFWLPELGWSPELDEYLRAYNISYTIINPHGLFTGTPRAQNGNFYPVKTPRGTLILGRDFNVYRDFWHEEDGLVLDPDYLDIRRDAGYELPFDHLGACLKHSRGRSATGYIYRTRNGALYDPARAEQKAAKAAELFLEKRLTQLSAARELVGGQCISLNACNAGEFGFYWREGPAFLEALFREAARNRQLQFMNPLEYLYAQDTGSYQTMTPEFSSWGVNGYAETWLDASNDWIYRHIFRSLERMRELADRFPENTGLKERTLNQAAREILLVQESYWPKMMSGGDNIRYARRQIENSLRNFTTIYESLGSNYISTEWLTSLEKRNNIFSEINYRVFRRKR
jgi:1,4-alpha-glucan branching enzyme